MIKSLAGKVGEFIYVGPSSHDFRGNFYRANSMKLRVQNSGTCFWLSAMCIFLILRQHIRREFGSHFENIT